MDRNAGRVYDGFTGSSPFPIIQTKPDQLDQNKCENSFALF